METIKYIGISKTKSKKFDRYDYLISFNDSDDLLITGEYYMYTFLEASYKKGSKRGFIKLKFSMLKSDFYNHFNLENGEINLVCKG